MSEPSPEKKFGILCQILRAQHFAFREAADQLCPDVDPADVVMRMWEVTGEQTARAYLKRFDRDEPLARQFGDSIAWSSRCMGEDAVVEAEGDTGEVFVRHRACPWFDWHKRKSLLAEDRPGCDAWFRTTIEAVNRDLGSNLQFETLEALPEGGSCCRRRIWVED